MHLATVVFVVAALFSCNKYLDVLPDNRTELDTPEKMAQMLVSAYPPQLPTRMQETMSDNMKDSGEEYGGDDEMYLFWDVSSIYQDSPYAVWVDCYHAVAAANHVLAAAEEYKGPEDLSYIRGEALICRAFAHFVLANTFCQAYNPQTSTVDLGIPYCTEPETTVHVDYKRGTVAQVYAAIEADIEAAWPLIDDTYYQQPTYHFTRRATAAFAAQFYLYYGKYEKSLEYSDFVLGEDPVTAFRNWDLVGGTSFKEITNTFNSSEESANLLNIGFNSWFGRSMSDRCCMTNDIVNETLSSPGPWGSRLHNYNRVWGWGNRGFAFPKRAEYFVVTNQTAGTGHGFIVVCYYTVEKTLLDRAEALTHLKRYDEAAKNLCWFYQQGKGDNYNLSAEQISAWYETASDKYRKPLAPRFHLEAGMQTNLIHAVLHARRIGAMHDGNRLEDIKRYGISYSHPVDKNPAIHIEPYDKRLAIQIPDAVSAAGIERNPR